MKSKKEILYSIFYILHSSKGFSLIESLVAIAVLILAVTGTLTIASKSIAISGQARDQVTATYLAEEGMEFVRNTRDNNVLAGRSWVSGLGLCVGGPGCTVDVSSNQNQVSPCPGDCPPLRLSEEAIYNYSSFGSPTIFKRTISITELVSGKEMIVRVTMQWRRQLLERSLVIQEHLFDWQ